jgi:hypothetical protein
MNTETLVNCENCEVFARESEIKSGLCPHCYDTKRNSR